MITADVNLSRLEKVGFLYRQRRGFGHFFRDEQAGSWGIAETLRRVPRLDIVQGVGLSRRVVIRHARGGCTPSIYIDGISQRWAAGDIEEAVGGMEISAIEVYRGLDTPPEFTENIGYRPCGAIVVWTRR